MHNENVQDRSDLVRSLAATIHKKIMEPAADKIDIVNLELEKMNHKVSGLEKELSALAGAHHRTRLLAVTTMLVVAVCAAFLIIPHLWR